MERRTLLKLASIFFFVLAISFLLGKIFVVNLADLRDIVSGFGIFAPLGYTLLLTLGLSVPFNPISDYLVVNLAVILLPLHFAIIGTFVAHSLSLTINYFIGRKYGWRLISKLTSEKEQEKIKELSHGITPLRIFYLRWLLPLTAIGIDIVSYAAGIAKIPFRKFFLSSIVPWTTLNILFFVSTKLLIDINIALILIPGLVLIFTPVIIHLTIRKIRK